MTSKKEVMTFLSTNKKVLEDMEITVLFGNSIKTEDIEGIEAYLEKVDTNKEYNDITPKKISNISSFLKLSNDKKEVNVVQIYRDYNNKWTFKNLSEYLTFRTKLSMFDYRIRAILTVINSDKMDKLSNKVELEAF